MKTLQGESNSKTFIKALYDRHGVSPDSLRITRYCCRNTPRITTVTLQPGKGKRSYFLQASLQMKSSRASFCITTWYHPGSSNGNNFMI